MRHYPLTSLGGSRRLRSLACVLVALVVCRCVGGVVFLEGGENVADEVDGGDTGAGSDAVEGDDRCDSPGDGGQSCRCRARDGGCAVLVTRQCSNLALFRLLHNQVSLPSAADARFERGQIIERQGPSLPDQLALKAANAQTDKQVP